jgi:hypothetical protein
MAELNVVETGDVVEIETGAGDVEPGMPKIVSGIHIKRTWANNITWYGDGPQSKFILDIDADVADLEDALGNDCRWSFDGKSYLNGKLVDNGFLCAPHCNEIKCTMRIGGGPMIFSYISSVQIRTNSGNFTLAKNWLKRSHREAKEICNDIHISDPNTSYVIGHGHDHVELDGKSDEWLNSNMKISMDLLYTPEGYRLDFTSINNHNVYLMEEDTKKIIDVNFAADWPDQKTCNLTQTVHLGLKPRKPLKRNTIYMLCINTEKYLANKYGNFHMKTMNPYYPPGVADSSDGFSSSWRSAMGGELIYCFRFI